MRSKIVGVLVLLAVLFLAACGNQITEEIYAEWVHPAPTSIQFEQTHSSPVIADLIRNLHAMDYVLRSSLLPRSDTICVDSDKPDIEICNLKIAGQARNDEYLSMFAQSAPNYHPFATALSNFFADPIPTPTAENLHWPYMPYSTHAIVVDIDGNGTQGVLASRWVQGQGSHYRFRQYLLWLCGDELHKASPAFAWFGITHTGRLVIMDEIGACNISVFTHTLLDFVDGELSNSKTIAMQQHWALGWMLYDYDDPDYLHIFGTYYTLYTYASGNPWQTQNQVREGVPMTYEEFDNIMTQYGLHNITNVWELPDETQAILSWQLASPNYGFAAVLNAYAEFERSGFTVLDDNLIAQSYSVARHHNTATTSGWERQHKPQLMYAFHDMNGSGTPELFVGWGLNLDHISPSLIAVYTLQNGSPVPLIYEQTPHSALSLFLDIYGEYIINRSTGPWGNVMWDYIYGIDEMGNLLELDIVFAMRCHEWCEYRDMHIFDRIEVYRTDHENLWGNKMLISEDEHTAILTHWGIYNNAGLVELPWEYLTQLDGGIFSHFSVLENEEVIFATLEEMIENTCYRYEWIETDLNGDGINQLILQARDGVFEEKKRIQSIFVFDFDNQVVNRVFHNNAGLARFWFIARNGNIIRHFSSYGPYVTGYSFCHYVFDDDWNIVRTRSLEINYALEDGLYFSMLNGNGTHEDIGMWQFREQFLAMTGIPFCNVEPEWLQEHPSTTNDFPRQHVVQLGQNLTIIARIHYGTERVNKNLVFYTEHIRQYNNMRNDQVLLGQVLNIPAPPAH